MTSHLITDAKSARKAARQALETQEKRKRGRPSTFTPDNTQRIIELIRNGLTIVEIAERDDCPAHVTINKWMDQNRDFAQAVARAREAGAWALTDMAMRIADTIEVGETSAMVARARLRVDTRFKLAAAWNAQAFGTKPGLSLNLTAETLSVVLSPEQMASLAGNVSSVVDVTPEAGMPQRTIAPRTKG